MLQSNLVRKVSLGLAVAALTIGVALSFRRSAPAALAAPNIDLPLPNIIVNTTAIADDQFDGKCDLWEALQAVFQANFGLSPTYHECTAKVGAMNIIAFSVVGGTITVPAVGPRTDLPFVHGETVILGPITIAGGGVSADTHLLRTAPGAKLTVIAVVLKNGHTSGAGPAIYSDNGATVNVIGSFLINNTADNDGGAIYSNGDLNLMGTSFANNQTGNTPGRGGAVYMTGSGSFKSEASTFTNNKSASGGAIYLEKPGGESSISESIFTANGVSSDANGFGGGAVYNASTGGTLEINRTAFNANYSLQGAGGALVNKVSATTYISNTLFDANIAGDPAHARNGGGVYNQGILSIVKSTLVGNIAQGGSGGALVNESAGNVSIANSTFNSNVAESQGGAFYGTASSTLAIRNSTFSANDANNPGSILYLGGTSQAQIGNTIFDGSASLTSNCAGNSPTSVGHNIDTGISCGFNAIGDMNLTNPLLDSLGFNGGSLPVLTTQKPSYSSPAVDHGDPVICAHPSVGNEDETGTQRPKDANNTGTFVCDIGAIELAARAPAFDADPMPPGPINFGSVQINHVLTTSFTVHNAGNYTLTLSGPAVGDAAHFGVSTTFPIDLSVNAQKTIVLACKPTVTGALATTFSFHTTDADKLNVSYSLLCNGVPNPAPAFVSLPVAPGPIEFGDVTIGEVVTQYLTIKNNGTADLTLTNVGFTSDAGNFAHDLVTPVTIGPAATHQIAVRCQPNRVGALAGQLNFSTNDTSQASASYNLNCNGLPPQSAYLVNTENLQAPVWLPSDFTGLFGVATSPDGINAYVTGNVTGGGQVAVLKRLTSGILAGTYLSTSQVTDILLGNAHEVAVSPDGQYVLATGGSDNALAEYQRDGGNGDLTPLFTISNLAGLNDPIGVAFSPDSQFAYVTNYSGNSISIFKHIGNAFFYTGSISSTTMTTHTLANPTGIVVSPDGKNVYVSVHTGTPSLGTLAVYRRDATTGALTPIQTRFQGDTQDTPGCFICFPVNGLASTYKLAISPDGYNVYVTSWYNHAIANFRRDPVTGLLTYYGSLSNSNIGGSGLTNAFGVVVSPDGKHVYVTGYGDSALVMFDREHVNGYLTFREAYFRDAGSGTPALSGAVHVAVSSDGGYVFALGQFDKAIAIFRTANPIPALFSLQPASVAAGSSSFTLVVKGAGFVDGAYVAWDGFHPTTTYFNSSEVRASIPAAYVTSAGNHTIKVTNPTPGGGDSFNTLTFKVIAPAATPIPSIDHLNPAGVEAGAANTTVDVYGANFVTSSSTVLANNTAASTTFIDSTHLRATLASSLLAQPGTVNVQVRNGAATYSNIVGLDVAAPGQNPVPSITSISPSWTWSLGAGSPEFTLVVNGTNFVDGATVQWNGSDRPTKFISSTKLQATIFGADQLDPSTSSIMAQNPAPGGGTSNVLTFIVRQLFKLFIPMVIG
jgi:predicted outer membrane repeat protein